MLKNPWPIEWTNVDFMENTILILYTNKDIPLEIVMWLLFSQNIIYTLSMSLKTPLAAEIVRFGGQWVSERRKI